MRSWDYIYIVPGTYIYIYIYIYIIPQKTTKLIQTSNVGFTPDNGTSVLGVYPIHILCPGPGKVLSDTDLVGHASIEKVYHD